MIKVVTLTVGELATNCYLAICEQTNQCLIIDPADDANYISEKIISLNLEPCSIVATHGHFDHVLAASELQMAFEIPFLIHRKDEPLLKKMSRSASWWLKRELVELPPKIGGYIKEDSIVHFGESKLRVAHTPGHTPGGVILYNKENKISFVGDLIFENGVGRTDFSYSNQRHLEKSLEKVQEKIPGFLVYPGHGNCFHL